MATWQAEIKVTNTGSYFPVTVEAGASYVAKETIQHIYSPITIRNLHQVSNRSSSNPAASEASMNATVGLLGLIAVGWAFMTFTPWILMTVGGAAGAWIGEKVTGQSIEDYNERDDDLGHGKAGIVLALALILGGVGFAQGDSIKKGFDVPSDTPAQVSPKN
jgi:hypothetical protein